MPKIVKSYAGTDLVPKIEVTNNAFKITLPNLNYSSHPAPVYEPPTVNEERILSLLSSRESIVREDVDALLGVSQSTSNRILKRMMEKQFILQSGSGKNTRYINK